MKHSVKTRWNPLTQAIQRALYLRLALHKLITLPKYVKRGSRGLLHYKLEESDWKLLQALEPILNVSSIARFAVL